MEKITEQQKEELKKILDEGGRIIDTTIREKDKIMTIRKIEPVNGEVTSSKFIQTKDGIEIICS